MRLNEKGFTLIELLAVIVLLAVLMIVAIPAIAHVIEDSRRDTFLDIAKLYANEVKTKWAANEITCSYNGKNVTSVQMPIGSRVSILISSVDSSSSQDTKDAFSNNEALLENAPKSSWFNLNISGYVNAIVGGVRVKPKYYVQLVDERKHGLKLPAAESNWKETEDLKRADVKSDSGLEFSHAYDNAFAIRCVVNG